MKYFLYLIVFTLTSFLSYGQRIVVPLDYNQEQIEHYQANSHLRLSAVGDTLTLPFFDDFTSTNIFADTKNWLPNGGTFINNSYAINPPNFNVATFDGVAENGIPYSTANQHGLTDQLISKPINLSGLKAKVSDSLYLKFFWQAKGYGEVPNSVDSLRLQFKDTAGVWRTQWKVNGGDSTPFNLKIIRIGNFQDSAKYYFKGFQFRFQSFGKKNGNFDTWNVDYIMLDTGRLAKDNWTPDYTFSSTPSRYLKNYTAMPAEQYFPFQAKERADIITVTATHLTNKERGFGILSSLSKLEDIRNNIVYDNINNFSNITDPKLINTGASTYYKKDSTIKYTLPPITTIPNDVIPRTLKYTFTLNNSLTEDPNISGQYEYTGAADMMLSRINFTKNDSISGYTRLTDYYSYDDGTAELGYAVNQELAKIAVKYRLNAPDTLTHVNICFPKTKVDQSLKSIILTVWSTITLGSNAENILYREEFLVKQSTSLNNFYTYQLATPLIFTAADSFYVGFQQLTAEPIFVGFDRSEPTLKNNFYNVNEAWIQETFNKGNLMIRPVFAGPDGILGNKPHNKPVTSTKKLEAEVYPNPTTGEVSIAGKITRINLYDVSGRLLLSKEYDSYTNEVKTEDLSFLPNGLYIMHLENKEAKAVKKIILNR